MKAKNSRYVISCFMLCAMVQSLLCASFYNGGVAKAGNFVRNVRSDKRKTELLKKGAFMGGALVVGTTAFLSMRWWQTSKGKIEEKKKETVSSSTSSTPVVSSVESPENQFCQYVQKVYGYANGDRVTDLEGQKHIARVLQTLYKYQHKLSNEKVAELFKAVSRVRGENYYTSIEELVKKVIGRYPAISFDETIQRYTFAPSPFLETTLTAVQNSLTENKKNITKHERVETKLNNHADNENAQSYEIDRTKPSLTSEEEFRVSLSTAYHYFNDCKNIYEETTRKEVAVVLTELRNRRQKISGPCAYLEFDQVSEAEISPAPGLQSFIRNLELLYKVTLNQDTQVYELDQ